MELIYFPVQCLFSLSYVSNSLSVLTCKCSWRRWWEMTCYMKETTRVHIGARGGLAPRCWAMARPRAPDCSSGRSLPLLNQSSNSTPEQMLCFARQTFYEMYMNYKGPGGVMVLETVKWILLCNLQEITKSHKHFFLLFRKCFLLLNCNT